MTVRAEECHGPATTPGCGAGGVGRERRRESRDDRARSCTDAVVLTRVAVATGFIAWPGAQVAAN